MAEMKGETAQIDGRHHEHRGPVSVLNRQLRRWTLATLLATAAVPVRLHADEPRIILPKHRITASEVAILVNDSDPLSRMIADYYRKRRNIPPENVIHITLDPEKNWVAPKQFSEIKRRVDAQTPEQIQAYVLTWAQPYKVGCMSITSAFAFGFDTAWCSSTRCAPTRHSAYFNSASAAPYQDHKIRPTMALAATDIAQARALIERGIASDGSRPAGTAYLLSTKDRARNVRAMFFPQMVEVFSPVIKTELIESNQLTDRSDVMFYVTGRANVEGLDSLTFLPGAAADHLTSAGGKLTDSRQMSSLRWLEAGATGSYGTVREPCNLVGKFPNPGLLMQHYLQGETLIEAYWKSVQMPGEGIFIGEPLAAPFDFLEMRRDNGAVTVHTRSIAPGVYQLEAAASAIGPFRPTGAVVRIGFPAPVLRLPDAEATVFRLRPIPRAMLPVQSPTATP